MIKLGPNRFMVERPDELPRFQRAEELFLDVETTSWDPGLVATNPYRGDRICGIAVTADDCPDSFYIPIRHRKQNVELEPVLRWLDETVGTCQDWINHSIIFDAIMCHFDGASFNGRIVDTLTLSKCHYSDRMSHGLKELCREWCELDMAEEDRVKAYLKGIGSKDYGDVPPDMLGDYACGDVWGNRHLYRYLVENRPESMEQLWRTEIDLTSVLFDAELDGLRINPTEVKVDYAKRLRRQIFCAERLAELTGREFTNSHACVYDILVNQLGLPVLARKDPDDEESNSTFDKKALALYSVHPEVTSEEDREEIVQLIGEYRDHQYLCGHYKSWLELVDEDDRIHPSYNQVVRTGRMSCRNPNIQGIDKRERRLILPDEGHAFISCDYSQIEFRLIVHYINDTDAIRAYNENPDTDFHTWVAELIGIPRRPAKRLNFGMGYGAGKRRVTRELSAEPDVIEEVGNRINEMVAAGELHPDDRGPEFHRLCYQKAVDAYNSYHDALPGIQRTAKDAQRKCRGRGRVLADGTEVPGYVFNAYGRRRYLPDFVSRKAFNAIVQGCAMDIMKERMVALSPRFNARSRELGMKLKLNVHDEVTFAVPEDHAFRPEIQNWIHSTLETPSVEFKVPIRCGMGISLDTWAEASGEKNTRQLEDGRTVGELLK